MTTTTATTNLEHWQAQAACRATPDLFFGVTSSERALARHICLTHCPVLDRCRADIATRGPLPHATQAGTVYNDHHRPRPLQNQPKPSRNGCPICVVRHEAPPTSTFPNCGTLTAHRKHGRRGEKPCRPCTDARLAYDRERAAQRRAQEDKPPAAAQPRCGTTQGYRHHLNQGEQPCPACIEIRDRSVAGNGLSYTASTDPGLIRRIRDLTGRGLGTRAISDATGLSIRKVQRIKKAHGLSGQIPAAFRQVAA